MESKPPDIEETAQDLPVKRKLPNLTKLSIIVGILLIQSVTAYYLQKAFVFRDAIAGNSSVAKEAKKHQTESETTVVMLDEIVVNPAGTAGRRYLAVSIGLQTASLEAGPKVEKVKPLVRDALISLLSSKQLDQLSSVTYRDTLRTEIKETVTKFARDMSIENVVFTGYVLQ